MLLRQEARQLFEDLRRKVAPVGELDDARAAGGAGRGDVLGHLQVGVVKDRNQAGIDDGVENLQSGEPCHVALSPSSSSARRDPRRPRP